jgi:hypothetical protein
MTNAAMIGGRHWKVLKLPAKAGLGGYLQKDLDYHHGRDLR